MSLPLLGAIILGIGGAIVVGASAEVINFWPQPPSIAPYFGWEVGAWWGLVVGVVTGLIIGFITDDKHFENPES